MEKIALMVATLFFVSATAHAAPVKILGAGSYTCGNHTSSSEAEKVLDLQWVTGYLSAMSIGTQVDFLQGVDSPAIAGALDLYCKNSPLDMMAAAAGDIYKQLLKRAKK